jgi:hypothetical protein
VYIIGKEKGGHYVLAGYKNPIKGVFEIVMDDNTLFYRFPKNEFGYYGFDAKKSELIVNKDKNNRIPVLEYYDEENDVHLFMKDHTKKPRDFKSDLKHRIEHIKATKFE